MSSALAEQLEVPMWLNNHEKQALFEEVAMAHLAWIEEAGKGMLSFYQAADPGGAPPAGWRSVLLDGRTFWLNSTEEANAVLWRANGVLYLLAGKLPEAELLRMALSVNTLGTHAYQHSRIES